MPGMPMANSSLLFGWGRPKTSRDSEHRSRWKIRINADPATSSEGPSDLARKMTTQQVWKRRLSRREVKHISSLGGGSFEKNGKKEAEGANHTSHRFLTCWAVNVNLRKSWRTSKHHTVALGMARSNCLARHHSVINSLEPTGWRRFSIWH